MDALFPDDRYEIIFLGNSFLDNGKIHIIKVKKKKLFKKSISSLFNAFSYKFSDEFIGVLKRLNKRSKQPQLLQFSGALNYRRISVEFLFLRFQNIKCFCSSISDFSENCGFYSSG